MTNSKVVDLHDLIGVVTVSLRQSSHPTVVFTRIEAEAILAALQVVTFDCTRFPGVEAKAIEWANRIAGPKGRAPYHPDPIGVLEMCTDIMAAGLDDAKLRRGQAPRAMCRDCRGCRSSRGQPIRCERCEGSGYDPED